MADVRGMTPAFIAAQNGHEGCLRVLRELGAGGSFSMSDAKGDTPAHPAAHEGHEGCLRVLHQSLAEIIDPLLQQHDTLLALAPTTSQGFLEELKMAKTLSQCDHGNFTPAHQAAGNGHIGCIEFLNSIGGAEMLHRDLLPHPDVIEQQYPCMLEIPSLLNIATKQAWLAHCLSEVVGDADASALSLVAHRSNLLVDLCAQLGVDESTGIIIQANAVPRPIAIQFHGESAVGDGLRREWFGEVLKEMLDPARGLFVSKDGGCTLQPSPHAATTAGPDHLSYFGLLGRLAGLALYSSDHRTNYLHGKPQST